MGSNRSRDPAYSTTPTIHCGELLYCIIHQLSHFSTNSHKHKYTRKCTHKLVMYTHTHRSTHPIHTDAQKYFTLTRTSKYANMLTRYPRSNKHSIRTQMFGMPTVPHTHTDKCIRTSTNTLQTSACSLQAAGCSVRRRSNCTRRCAHFTERQRPGVFRGERGVTVETRALEYSGTRLPGPVIGVTV